MITVLLILHLMIAASLVGVVLLQRSEGGALGIGGGGGGFMSGRGAANFLTRVTAGLAAAFFATSILLTLLATRTERAPSVFDTPPPRCRPRAPRPYQARRLRPASRSRSRNPARRAVASSTSCRRRRRAARACPSRSSGTSRAVCGYPGIAGSPRHANGMLSALTRSGR